MTATTAYEKDPPSMDGGGPEALFRLGLLYCLGQEVPRDLVEAHKWFNLAALSGDARARQYRGEISREMSPAEIAEAQRQARSWLHSH